MTIPMSAIHEEERAARKRERDLARARTAAAKARDQQARSKLAAVIREELSRPRAKGCKCGLKPGMTLQDVMDLGAGCTAGRWVCPVLDAVRRKMGR